MKIFRDTLYFFLVLAIIFLPAPSYLLSFQNRFGEVLSGDLITFICNEILHHPPVNDAISSDSISMYLLLLILLFIAFILANILSRLSFWNPGKEKFIVASRLLMVYYLSFQLLSYGADKLFKAQFYQPEPNILFTPFGYMEKDILYWSVIGTSYGYNIFLGICESLAALLLLSARTRLMGLLLSFTLLINIAAINLSFDISVKLLSLFLLLTNILLLWKYFPFLVKALSGKQVPGIMKENSLMESRFLKSLLKIFIILFLFFEASYPGAFQGKLNDDAVPRPYLRGAYQVLNDSGSVKKIFIHRDGYFIMQYSNDRTKDLKLFIDTISHKFNLIDYDNSRSSIPYSYNAVDSVLELKFPAGVLSGKLINYKKMPALHDKFHWTVDEIK